MISATAARPISGAVPAECVSPSFDGGFGLWCDLTTEYVAVIVARFLNSSMKEMFNLITTCAFAPTANARTARDRRTCFMKGPPISRRAWRSRFPTSRGHVPGVNQLPSEHGGDHRGIARCDDDCVHRSAGR